MLLQASEVALKENGDRKRLLHILIPTLESDVVFIQGCPYGTYYVEPLLDILVCVVLAVSKQ
jgi:hypothetical protein